MNLCIIVKITNNGEKMKYFAYGSNMPEKRIQMPCRVPSAKKLPGIFLLTEYELKFHKPSKDGSGKCSIYYTGDSKDFVLGVIYDINDSERKKLDDCEGLGVGYECKKVCVSGEKGVCEAFTYYATAKNPSLSPYCWYKHHVLTGAKESGFPAEYIAKIEAVKAKPDPDQDRAKKETDIYK